MKGAALESDALDAFTPRIERLVTSGQLERIVRSVGGASRPAPDLEEIRSRALLRMWRHHEELRGSTDGEMGGWVRAIVRSVAADLERQRAARARLARTLVSKGAVSDEGRALDRIEDAELIEHFLSFLSRQEAELLRRLHLEDWTLEELAAEYEVRESTLRRRRSRAIEKIRRMFVPD